MAFEHKPGSFTLFKNDKGDNDKRPDYRGDGMDLDGNMIEVAAWIKSGGKGKFMSCTIKRKEAQNGNAVSKIKSDNIDDVPF